MSLGRLELLVEAGAATDTAVVLPDGRTGVIVRSGDARPRGAWAVVLVDGPGKGPGRGVYVQVPIDKLRLGCAYSIQKMITALQAVLIDAKKHDGGNRAAGTRLRKAIQEVRHDATAAREQVRSDWRDREAAKDADE